MRAIATGAVGLLCAVLLAACGGGKDSGKADKDIADAVRTGFTSDDVDVKCSQVVTTAFVKRVYGDPATCRKAETPDPDDKPATGVTTSNTTVDGAHGTVFVELSGGDSDGAKGTVDVAKESGKWRVDDFEPDLLRSQFSNGINRLGPKDGTAFASAASKSCVVKQVNGLGDADLQRLAYGALAKSDAAEQQLTSLATKCVPEQQTPAANTSSQKVSFLRSKFEQGLASSARKDGASKQTISCIKQQMRRTVSDDDIVRAIKAGQKAPPDLTAKAAEAIQACR